LGVSVDLSDLQGGEEEESEDGEDGFKHS
jgi:hypothetical protein